MKESFVSLRMKSVNDRMETYIANLERLVAGRELPAAGGAPDYCCAARSSASSGFLTAEKKP